MQVTCTQFETFLFKSYNDSNKSTRSRKSFHIKTSTYFIQIMISIIEADSRLLERTVQLAQSRDGRSRKSATRPLPSGLHAGAHIPSASVAHRAGRLHYDIEVVGSQRPNGI